MTTAQTGPGRPRSRDATDRVLAATRRLLDERGVAGLRIDDVVRESGVAKTTIYRRWTSLTGLIVAVMEAALGPRPLPDTGDVEADLLTLTRVVAESMARTPLARALPLIGLEVMQQPELAAAYRARIIDPVREHGIRLVRAGVAGGLFRAGTDPALVVDTVAGLMIYRSTVLHENPSAADAMAVAAMTLRSIRAPGASRGWRPPSR
ncbi:TetR/AcrR family transcriptional regulator [Actinoplanes nipponensis]|uniref:TetR/AcrR family transcriptional regulator n=1 Tax=Actinoplanes nipponensis TaxID=135950 RepID=UPI0019430C74|nr:TetR/AcrR family transcriptional regulator [Actinoplanes nipponensis]